MNLKKIAIAFTIASILVGCSSGSKKVDGKDVVASLKDKDFLADDLYSSMLDTSSSQYLSFAFVEKNIINHYFPQTDDMKLAASLMREQIEESYQATYGSSWKDELNKAVVQSGFTSMDDYEEQYSYNLQYREYISKYVNDNYDMVYDDYFNLTNPRMVSHILVKMAKPDAPTEEEQEKLDRVKARLAAGEDFATIAKEESDDGSASAGGNLGICDINTSFVTEFKTAALSAKKGVPTGAVKSEYGYHFILVTEDDKAALKDNEQIKTENILSYDSYISVMIVPTYTYEIKDEKVLEYVNSFIASEQKERELLRKEGSN